MNCIDVQDWLPEIVDDRPIEASRHAELAAHLDSCDACRTELELSRATKITVARAVRPHPAPPAMVEHIRGLLHEEDRLDAIHSGAPAQNIMRFIRKRPLWAVGIAAAFVVVLLAWPRGDHERRFNESSLSFVDQAIETYDGLIHNTQKVQIQSTNENELRKFFADNGVTCSVIIPQSASMQLIGGSVTVKNKARVAHLMYHCGDKTICLCQMNITDCCSTNQTALSDSAKSCIAAGNWYWYRKDDGRTCGLHKFNNTLCAATSQCDQQEIASLFSNNQ